MRVCDDCDTTVEDEMYMVNHEIWEQATSVKRTVKYLCIMCLEERLLRRLRREDFMIAGINLNGANRSKRLLDRLETRPYCPNHPEGH